MVSTRGVKFKFSEGERVLCYELDTNKARLLYDSKILECCVGRDSGGKKCAEYLVHFYGWNSSWDRCVAEINIIKDTSDNRQIQRKLAEHAAQALKGKKLKLNKIPAIIKEIVVNSSNINSSDVSVSEETNDSNEDSKINCEDIEDTNDLEDDDHNNELIGRESETFSTGIPEDISSLSEINTIYNEQELQKNTQIYSLTIELKHILDKDYLHSCVNKLLYELPIKPNVSDIIDEFCENSSNYEAMDVQNLSTTGQTQNHYQILISEFKSSIEVYFNALIENNYLFYNEEERTQYLQYCGEDEAIKVYGFNHLLRLLVSMSDFLLSTPGITKKHLKVIIAFIQLFIDYLNKNRFKF